MNGFIKNHVENIKVSLNKETLSVSLGTRLRVAKLKNVSYFRSRAFPEGFVDSKEVQGNVVRYFASFDEAIHDFTVEEFSQEDAKDASKSYKLGLF